MLSKGNYNLLSTGLKNWTLKNGFTISKNKAIAMNFLPN